MDQSTRQWTGYIEWTVHSLAAAEPSPLASEACPVKMDDYQLQIKYNSHPGQLQQRAPGNPPPCRPRQPPAGHHLPYAALYIHIIPVLLAGALTSVRIVLALPLDRVTVGVCPPALGCTSCRSDLGAALTLSCICRTLS